MRYQSIILELLMANPELHEQLKSQRRVLATMKTLALELRQRHLEILTQLEKQSPQTSPWLLSAQALELALPEFAERISSGVSDDATPFDLDAAMATLVKATPPG